MNQKRCEKCGKLFKETEEICDKCSSPLVPFDSTTVVPKKLPNPITAYVNFFKDCLSFTERSSRFEYWIIFLDNLFVCALIAITTSLISSIFVEDSTIIVVYSIFLYFMIIFIPLTSLTVRRFHDVSLSGWLLLIGIIPVLGWLYVISSMTRPGSNQDNKFGKNPYLGREIPDSTYNGFFGTILDNIF